jgi:branched-subunit amino acid ABC-type transport system permease component
MLEHVLADLVLPGIVAGCVYSLVATGINVLDRTTKTISFAYGDYIMWAPMAALAANVFLQWPIGISIVAGLLVAVAFALLVEFFAVRPFIDKPRDFAWILSTLGASLILQRAAFLPFSGEQRAFIIGPPNGLVRLGSLALSYQDIFIIVAAVVVAVGLYFIYNRTRIGKTLVAVGEDPDGARAIGISPERMSQVSAAIAGVVAAITGLVVAPMFLVSPHMGFQLLFTGFVAATFGGLGSLPGGYIGGFVVGFLIQATGAYGSSEWTHVVLFGALLTLYAIRPWGLFGSPPMRAV